MKPLLDENISPGTIESGAGNSVEDREWTDEIAEDMTRLGDEIVYDLPTAKMEEL